MAQPLVGMLHVLSKRNEMKMKGEQEIKSNEIEELFSLFSWIVFHWKLKSTLTVVGSVRTMAEGEGTSAEVLRVDQEKLKSKEKYEACMDFDTEYCKVFFCRFRGTHRWWFHGIPDQAIIPNDALQKQYYRRFDNFICAHVQQGELFWVQF